MHEFVSKTYQRAIDTLSSQGKFYINLGLERVQNALQISDNPQKKLQFIHVAGTNGKGSVCAMLSSILAQSGLRVGLFTSPHIFEYTERIKINDVKIDKEIFAQKLFEIVEHTEKNQIHLSEFEILTVLAFDYFAQNQVDIVVLETGLGGRLDATNVIEENLCSIITHIDLDHIERLGDTIEKIAGEKAGIIKENCPVVLSPNNAGLEVIKQVAEAKRSKLFVVPTEPQCEEFVNFLSLRGDYQRENLSLVLGAIDILKEKDFEIGDGAIEQGLRNVEHSCRFEHIKEHNLIVDGAHNPDGARVLRESLEKYFPNQNYRFIFGCLKHKDYTQMMKNLFRKDDEIYFYRFKNENACRFEELSPACEFDSKPFAKFVKDDKLTVICGSFYMIKELFLKMGLK